MSWKISKMGPNGYIWNQIMGTIQPDSIVQKKIKKEINKLIVLFETCFEMNSSNIFSKNNPSEWYDFVK